jgi:hypothetical protein
VNTPSHLIINAALRKRATSAGLTIPRGPFLLGAVLPDIPLTLLWIGAYVWYRSIQGDPSITLMDETFDRLYFTHPLWIASYNTLHSPTLLLAALALLWRFRTASAGRGRWWFWFLAGCLVHSALDIPVHVNDGPLLFFPFEWSIRFQSPVSYWDPRHYGRQFALFELLLDLALRAYLFGPATGRWLARRRAARVEH